LRFFNRLKIRYKILLGIAGVVLFFGILSGLLVSRIAARSLVQENKARGTSLVRSLASRAIDPVLASDYLRMQNMVDEFTALSEFYDYAFIQDAQGEVVTHTFDGGFPVDLKSANQVEADGKVGIRLLDTGRSRIYDFAAPLFIGEGLLGTMRIGISQSQVRLTVNTLLATVIMITAGVGAAAMLLGTLFSDNIAKRINKLQKSAESVVLGNLNIQTGPWAGKTCREIMHCTLDKCPAYKNVRHRCWYMAGTLCPECEGKTLLQKPETCRDCKVYKAGVGDEIQSLAETFDFMALSLRDHINELTRIQADVMRQKQLLNTILDVTPDIVSLRDESLGYMAVNRAFRNAFDIGDTDVVGKTNSELFGNDMPDFEGEEDAAILKDGKPQAKQVFVGKEEHRRWFHVIKMPVHDGDKRIGLLMTARDISVIKRYQERLIHSQKMEDLGKLSGGVAHEINTPLGVILGYAQLMLEDTPADSQMHKDLEIIEKQTKICRRIVSDLLGFSRNVESAMEPMDVNASIRDVLAVVENIFKQERVEIVADLSPHIPEIVGDREKLKQVWINLLNNAFDAVGSDGVIVVRTALCSSQKAVMVSVADSGRGIPADVIGKIYEPFFSTKPSGKGTGLGLSITSGIIGDHNGRIFALSPAPLEALTSSLEENISILPLLNDQSSSPGTVMVIELPKTSDGLPDELCPEARALKSASAKLQKAGAKDGEKPSQGA
jgi:PAS domain S-box-containing protein